MKGKYTEAMVFIVKLIIGITFIYASYHKIENPEAFARIIYGYEIFPHATINIFAIIIPFIELTVGFSLILGWFPRSALLIINSLLFLFILVVGFNLIRGHEFDCGCFAANPANQTLSNVYVLVRDMVLLGGGLFLFRNIRAS